MRTARLPWQLAAGLGLLALQVAVATAYLSRGTWWHYLLHQSVGWGLGLAGAALLAALVPWRRVPVLAALLAGQLWSIAPDVLFRYARMPHDPAMDAFAGHIAIHRAWSPVVAVWLFVSLAAAGWLLATSGRRRVGALVAGLAVAFLGAACLTAEPLPTRLSDVPGVTAPV